MSSPKKRETAALAGLGCIPVQQLAVTVHGIRCEWCALVEVGVAMCNMQIEARLPRERNLEPNSGRRRARCSASKSLLCERGACPEQVGFSVLGGKAVQGLVQHRRVGTHASTSPAVSLR